MRRSLVVAGAVAALVVGSHPAGTLAQGQACSPAYPDVCIPPPPPDLDCVDLEITDFAASPGDPHELDTDRDGIGCEGGLPVEKSLAPLFVSALAALFMLAFVLMLRRLSDAAQRGAAAQRTDDGQPMLDGNEQHDDPIRRIFAEELARERLFQVRFGVISATVTIVIGAVLSLWIK